MHSISYQSDFIFGPCSSSLHMFSFRRSTRRRINGPKKKWKQSKMFVCPAMCHRSCSPDQTTWMRNSHEKQNPNAANGADKSENFKMIHERSSHQHATAKRINNRTDVKNRCPDCFWCSFIYLDSLYCKRALFSNVRMRRGDFFFFWQSKGRMKLAVPRHVVKFSFAMIARSTSHRHSLPLPSGAVFISR